MSDDNLSAVRAVVQAYVDAARSGDVDAMRSLFHEQAQMVGHLGPDLLYGGPEPFYAAMSGNPAPARSGGGYTAEIVDVSVSGKVASATLRETGYLGMNFTDYFHLLNDGGRWLIVSKTFAHD